MLLVLCVLACSESPRLHPPTTQTPVTATGTGLLARAATATIAPTPVRTTILSPQASSLWNVGDGLLVDLPVSSQSDAGLMFAPHLRRTPGQQRPGHSESLPGLVVLLTSGHDDGRSDQKLASRFQISAASDQPDGTQQYHLVWSTRSAGVAVRGSAVLTAYVVKGAAPDVITASSFDSDPISNVARAAFVIDMVAVASATASRTTQAESAPGRVSRPSLATATTQPLATRTALAAEAHPPTTQAPAGPPQQAAPTEQIVIVTLPPRSGGRPPAPTAPASVAPPAIL